MTAAANSALAAVAPQLAAERVVFVLTGPTAVGKSRLAARLWRQWGANACELVSADSVKMYRGATIGSNKRFPPGCMPHYVDVREPSEPVSAGDFFRDARGAIDDVHARGKVPLVVGGSGFFLQALLYGLPPVPAAGDIEPAVVERVREIMDDMSNQASGSPGAVLAQHLTRADALEYVHQHVARNDTYRTRRALEIILSSPDQSPPPKWGAPDPEKLPGSLDYDFRCMALMCPRLNLYQAIDRRAEAMLRDGLLKEVSELVQRGMPCGRHLGLAVGYRQTLEFLEEASGYLSHTGVGDGPSVSSPGMIYIFNKFLNQIISSSHNLARRQTSWLRRDLLFLWHTERSLDPLAERATELVTASHDDYCRVWRDPATRLAQKTMRRTLERSHVNKVYRPVLKTFESDDVKGRWLKANEDIIRSFKM